MKRASIERHRTKNAWARHVDLQRNLAGLSAIPEIGRFRKSLRIGGCGNTACWLCHAGKLSGEARLAERRALFNFVEGLAEALHPDSSLERTREG